MSFEDILNSDSFPTEDALMSMIMHTSSTVWERELIKKHIDSWLSNFKGELFSDKHERLMALFLLSHFTFYSPTEVQRLCKVVYSDLMHLIIMKGAKGAEPSNTINEFFANATIVPSEAISGSGGFIAYLFRQVNELPMNLFTYSIDNINDQITNIITIDDVTLSSGMQGQMARFLKKHRARFKSKNLYLLTLISSQSSVEYLRNTFNIEVVTAIQMDARDQCFSKEADVFCSFPELSGPCKELAEHYGKKIGIGHPLGFRNGQYTFGFYYNAPDNTLPIFWAQVNGWIPIIKRHHKNYSARTFLRNERFI